MKSFGHYLLANPRVAGVCVIVFSVTPFLGWLSLAIVGLIALREGAKVGVAMLVASLLPIFVGLFWQHQTLLWWPLLFNSLFNVVFFGFALLLRATRSWKAVFLSALGLGMVIILLSHLLHSDLVGWWEQLLRGGLGRLPEKEQARWVAQLAGEGIARLAQSATGFVMTVSLASCLSTLLLSRWWQASLFNPGGLRAELLPLHFDYKLVVIFAVVILSSFLGMRLAMDFFPLLMGFYLLSGLLLVHCFAEVKLKQRGVFLVLFYLGFLLLYPVALGVMGIGLLDGVIDFRKRFAWHKSIAK